MKLKYHILLAIIILLIPTTMILYSSNTFGTKDTVKYILKIDPLKDYQFRDETPVTDCDLPKQTETHYRNCDNKIEFVYIVRSSAGAHERTIEVPTADVESFKNLKYGYGLDSKNVYYRGELIEGADPEKFYRIEFRKKGDFLETRYSRSGDDIFFETIMQESMTPHSFVK